MKTRFNQAMVGAEPKSAWSRFFKPHFSKAGSLMDTEYYEVASRTRGKVLVVDDDPVTLKALKFKLESSGYLVSTAVDYSEAATQLRMQRADVILLDIYFPPDVASGGGVPWDGFRIIQWLRNFEDIGQAPIILMSGQVDKKLFSRARTSGAVELLRKPIDTRRLLELLSLCQLKRKDPESSSFDI